MKWAELTRFRIFYDPIHSGRKPLQQMYGDRWVFHAIKMSTGSKHITAKNFQYDFFFFNEWKFVKNCIQHDRFFFLNFNSYFEAQKILKRKGSQKQVLWSFHIM